MSALPVENLHPQPILKELETSDIPSIFPLISELNPWMDRAQFDHFLSQMIPAGYRVVGVYDGQTLIGCAGFRIMVRFWCGKHLDFDNVIVTEAYRSAGIGKQLMSWLENKAAEEGCDLIVLDSYTASSDAHRFYFRHGFVITGYHFTKIPHATTPGNLPFRH